MRRTLLLVATLAVTAVAACEQAPNPTIAGLSGDGGTGTGTNTGGGGGGGAVITTLTIAPSSATIITGSSIQLITNVFNDQVRWESSNPAVAGVSPSGTVVGLSVGTAIIRVLLLADTTRQASAVITVVAAPGTMP